MWVDLPHAESFVLMYFIPLLASPPRRLLFLCSSPFSATPTSVSTPSPSSSLPSSPSLSHPTASLPSTLLPCRTSSLSPQPPLSSRLFPSSPSPPLLNLLFPSLLSLTLPSYSILSPQLFPPFTSPSPSISKLPCLHHSNLYPHLHLPPLSLSPSSPFLSHSLSSCNILSLNYSLPFRLHYLRFLSLSFPFPLVPSSPSASHPAASYPSTFPSLPSPLPQPTPFVPSASSTPPPPPGCITRLTDSR